MFDSDETLLERLKAENAHEAWEEFFALYWRPIVGYARKIGLDRAQADDVLQETMITLMRILPAFTLNRERGSFRNFLFTIVHRRSLHLLRRRRNEGAAFGTTGHNLETLAGAQPEPSALAAWRESLVAEGLRLLRADPALGTETFAVFHAYAVEGRPAEEVARDFGTSRNNVYRIKNRLLKRLQSIVARLARDSETHW
jgi:RNA polymerase sigma-70 factor (ECF subfamily)